MKLKNFAAVACLILAMAGMQTKAHAEAFGFEKGEPASKYGIVATIDAYFYEVGNIPNKHSLFYKYAVRSIEGVGITSVSATSNYYPNVWFDKYFDQIKKAISKKYNTEYTRINSSHNPFDINSFSKEENAYIYRLEGHKDIQTIILSSFKKEQDKSCIVLSYIFNNTEEAAKKVEALDIQAL